MCCCPMNNVLSELITDPIISHLVSCQGHYSSDSSTSDSRPLGDPISWCACRKNPTSAETPSSMLPGASRLLPASRLCLLRVALRLRPFFQPLRKSCSRRFHRE